MEETFATLKSILKKHSGRMTVVADTKQEYSLNAGYSEKWKKDVWFGGVRLGKSYVSYHLMPVYACPELVAGLSPALKKRMQGKSCFNFKTIDPPTARELSALTKASISRFRKAGLIRASILALVALLAPRSARAADTVPANGGDITIAPIIHSSVQIEHAGTVVQVDPWSVGDLSHAKPADLILITDDVGHHLDVKAIEQLRKPGAPVVIAANGKQRVPDGIVLPNGEHTTVAGVPVESIAAYDIKPGEPSHPKGEANGYVITLGGKRLYFAGVTECVPEVRALKNIDVAFVPMNIPLERMTPAAAAECVKAINPKVVYVYHYDQDFASRAVNPRAVQPGLPGGITVAQSLEQFRGALKGTSIDVRIRDWYARP